MAFCFQNPMAQIHPFMINQRLVTANHTHTWWYYMTPLTHSPYRDTWDKGLTDVGLCY